jgi:hypothetical protein
MKTDKNTDTIETLKHRKIDRKTDGMTNRKTECQKESRKDLFVEPNQVPLPTKV